MDLIPDKKILKIGKKEIDYSWICVGRVTQAMDLYNALLKQGHTGQYANILAITKAVIILIRVDFSLSWNWLKRRMITEKYIMRHLNYFELSDFMEVALEPILGDKKKELKAQQAIDEVMEKLLEKMTMEELIESLQKQLVSMDGQKIISSQD